MGGVESNGARLACGRVSYQFMADGTLVGAREIIRWNLDFLGETKSWVGLEEVSVVCFRDIRGNVTIEFPYVASNVQHG